jgi:tRNA(fMet)-specific endonuclease VapC
MIVFDTDVISELMRPRPSASLLERLGDVPVDEQATTSITLGELAYGARKAERPALYRRAVKLLRGVRILDFDRLAAEQYGDLRASLERNGHRLADPDLRIAAITTIHRATLISGNRRHFGRVPGLTVEDWVRG